MKKLILCLALSAALASLLHTYQWEKTARADWHALATAINEEGGK